MGQLTIEHIQYFDKMKPGAILQVANAQDPVALVAAAKEFIDQGGALELNPAETAIKKLYSFEELTTW